MIEAPAATVWLKKTHGTLRWIPTSGSKNYISGRFSYPGDLIFFSFLFWLFFNQSITCILPLYPSMNLIFLVDDGTSTCIRHVFMHVSFYFPSNHTFPPKENSPLPAEGRKQWSNNWAICTFKTCKKHCPHCPAEGFQFSTMTDCWLKKQIFQTWVATNQHRDQNFYKKGKHIKSSLVSNDLQCVH